MAEIIIKDEQNLPQDEQDITVHLLLEVLYHKYGYDFRNYSRAHIKRRLLRRMALDKFEDLEAMLPALLRDKELLEQLLADLSINATEMFRDPSFYKRLMSEVLPVLRTYPQIRIWIVGCSSGEEVYSVAILLKELELYEKSTVYATDFNEKILISAKEGIYPIELIKGYTRNYQLSGGLSSFSDYYVTKYSCAKFINGLKENIVFASHNLVTDSSFINMHLILCRNVMIYFDKVLKNRVLRLFHESLNGGCFLCLGTKENLSGTDFEDKFSVFAENERIYKKKLI